MLSNDDVRDNLAVNVRRLLEDRNMSQADLARRAGESENAISRVVRGCLLASSGTIARIAGAFDVSIDRLVTPSPGKNFPKIANAG